MRIVGIGETTPAPVECKKLLTPVSVSVALFATGLIGFYFYFVGHEHGVKYSKTRVRDGYKL